MTFGPTASFNFVSDDADVCGVDEAGRGPLAGPVVAAAVILDRSQPIEGLRDSKVLSEPHRVRLAIEIRRKAKAFAVAFASHLEIDGINILQASLLAMERAVLRLHVVPEHEPWDGVIDCTVRTASGVSVSWTLAASAMPLLVTVMR